MADVQAPTAENVNGNTEPPAVTVTEAAAPDTNGNAPAGPTENESPAAALARKHAEAEAESHRVTVEDVPDEDDLAHPGSKSAIATGQATPVVEPVDAVAFSSKAAGKKKQQYDSNKPPDFSSAEAFPSLGPARGPRPAAPPPSLWGATRPNGSGAASPGGSGDGLSGIRTPPAGPKPVISGVASELIRLLPEQQTPRNQLKKPVGEIMKDIQKATDTNIQLSTSSTGLSTYIIKGAKKENVAKARRMIFSAVSPKVTINVAIPANLRKFIIGAKGATVQGIINRTGTKITVPQVPEDQAPQNDDPFAEDESTIDIAVEGDMEGVQNAKAEIDAIVNEKTSHVNIRLPPANFPGHYYPFLAGPHNANIQAMEEGKDLKIKIPPYIYSDSSTAFSPAQAPISLVGERNAVMAARAELEKLVEELTDDFQSISINIPKPQHRFVVGERGAGIHDIMQESGCSVVLPPQHIITDKVMIVGPSAKIGAGVTSVMNKANSFHFDSIDIARAHRIPDIDPRVHARDLARYFKKRREMQRLEQEHDVQISLPSNQLLFDLEKPTVPFEIVGKDKAKVNQARKDIVNLVNLHPPHRLGYVDIDPMLHRHIIGLKGRNVQKLKEQHLVDIIFADEEDQDPQVVLIYEGSEGPSTNVEAEAAKAALDLVIAELLKTAEEQADVSTKDLKIPAKYHSKIVGKNGTTLNTFSGVADSIVHVHVGAPKRRPGQPALSPQQAQAADDNITIRGPSAAVERCAKEITAFVEETKHEEVLSSYTTSFDFPQKFSRNLVGKGGSNIQKLREELGVNIDLQDGKGKDGSCLVEIKGHKRNVEAAKTRIQSMGKKLEDDTTVSITVAPEHHRSIIGQGGKFVKRLEDKYSVRINFPRQQQQGQDGDNGSDAGTPSRHQAPDEVVIRGPSKGVRDAKEEILDLLKWEEDHGHTSILTLPTKVLPHIIGSGGKAINTIRTESGARIDLPPQGGDGEEADIKLRGTKTCVEKAKKMLLEVAKEWESSVVRTLNIDKKFHRTLIGPGGSNLRSIVIEAGGPDDKALQARIVRFPNQDSTDNTIKVEGNATVVDKLVSLIEKIVERESNKISIGVDVPTDKHRKIIGREGNVRREIEAKFNVTVDVPRQRQGQSVSSEVKISGTAEDVEKAKEHILELTKDQEGVTVMVPRRLHNAVSDGGNYVRKLRNDHNVTVDFGGAQLPPKPAKQDNAGRKRNTADMPLITDPAEASERAVSWQMVTDGDGDESAEGGDDIPWTLRGNRPEDITRAKAALEKTIAQASEHTTTGYLILPDPSKYRYVVGAGGSSVNKIRSETGCKVTIPKEQSDGEAIVIRGSREGVERAKEIILELVKAGGEGGNGGGRRGGGGGGRRGGYGNNHD